MYYTNHTLCSLEFGGGQPKEWEPGEKGVAGVWEVGEEWPGGGICKATRTRM